jgi:hypothetical protein
MGRCLRTHRLGAHHTRGHAPCPAVHDIGRLSGNAADASVRRRPAGRRQPGAHGPAQRFLKHGSDMKLAYSVITLRMIFFLFG